MGVPPGSRRVRTRWPIERRRSANKEIWVVFPLPSVPSKVMNGAFISQVFGSRPFGRVLDAPAFGLQLVPESVGVFEILGFAGGRQAGCADVPAAAPQALQSRAVVVHMAPTNPLRTAGTSAH